MSEAKTTDKLVTTTRTIDAANAVRSRLLEKNRRLWVFVRENPDGDYDISASNEFDSRLSDEEIWQLYEEVEDLVPRKQQAD